MKKFNELNLSQTVIESINALGFEEPSQIQAEAIPVVMEGFDIIGQAQTGTGKTLAFGAPIISKIKNTNSISALVLTPTRELAIQVSDEITRISKHSKTRIMPIYGGQPIDRQIKGIRRGLDIIVGTPGRILDHLNRRTLDLTNIDFLVLDEADEMLNMGFVEDIETIMKSSNPERQTLLFSATMPDEIKRLAKKYMKKDSKHIAIAKNTVTVDKIKQSYFEVKNKDRFDCLCRIIDFDEPASSIIFCKTKKGVDELVSDMSARGYNVDGMHGDMSQNSRISTLKKFKDGVIDFLVATDVAARGIDVDDVTHVINYDLPQDTESYVHRIGRTGRANKEGTAYSLVTPREYMQLKQIEKYTKSRIKRNEVPTIDDIYESKYSSITDKIKDTLAKDDFKQFTALATELDEEYSLVDVAAALMKMFFEKEFNFEYKAVSDVSDKKCRLFFSIGRIDKIDPKKILNFIIQTSNVDFNAIGNIDIYEKFSFVDIAENCVDEILNNSSGQRIDGRRVNIEIAKSKNDR